MPDSSTVQTEVMISELPAASQANATDQLEANQSGTTRSITVDQVATAVANSDQVSDAIDGAIEEAAIAPLHNFSSVAINPPAGFTKALSTTQNATGTASGPTNLNEFIINTDNIAAGANFVNGWTFAHHFGGGPTSGGREPMAVYGYLDTPTSPSSTNRNYVALTGYMLANAHDNGFNTTFSGSAGAIFGGGLRGELSAASTNMHHVTALEADIATSSGASVFAKAILTVTSVVPDFVKGSGVDAMTWFYRGGGTVRFNDGLLFGHPGDVPNSWPFDNTSTLVRTLAGTLGTGIDLSANTINTAAFKSPGFLVGGTGALSATTGTFTGTITGVQGEFSSQVQITTADGINTLFAHGPTKGVRIVPSATETLIQGVDAGITVVQPLKIEASTLQLTATSTAVSGLLTTFNATAIAAGAATQAFIKASSTADFGIFYGNNAPTFTAAKGSLYVNTGAASTTTRLYVNTTGSTTWANFTASA